MNRLCVQPNTFLCMSFLPTSKGSESSAHVSIYTLYIIQITKHIAVVLEKVLIARMKIAQTQFLWSTGIGSEIFLQIMALLIISVYIKVIKREDI